MPLLGDDKTLKRLGYKKVRSKGKNTYTKDVRVKKIKINEMQSDVQKKRIGGAIKVAKKIGMKIKTKLFLGLGLLFTLIIIIASMSIFYINALKKDTNNILVANYNTLEYARIMFISLDKLENDANALKEFQREFLKATPVSA